MLSITVLFSYNVRRSLPLYEGYKPLKIQINYNYPKYFVLLSRTFSVGTKEQLNVDIKSCYYLLYSHVREADNSRRNGALIGNPL